MSKSAASGTITWESRLQASGKTIASAVPWKSSTVSRAYSAPVFLLTRRLTAVTTTAAAT